MGIPLVDELGQWVTYSSTPLAHHCGCYVVGETNSDIPVMGKL
jgi:hypothetical protein